MSFTNDSYVTCNYYGKKIRVSPLIVALVGIIIDRIQFKWDAQILITGDVGSGKSNLAKTVIGLYQLVRNKKIDIDNFTWTSEGLVEFTERDDNEQEPIVYDEAIQGGSGKDVMTKGGKDLINALVTKRRKRHLTIVVVDQLQEYNRKFIARCTMMIDCRTKIKGGRQERGYFKVYSQKETLHLYTLLKKGSIRDIKQYSGYQKPFFRFWDAENVFINEDEYEEKKIEQTNRLLEDNSKINWSKEKVQGFGLWSKGDKKQVEIANIVDVRPSTVSDWVRDYRKFVVSEDI